MATTVTDPLIGRLVDGRYEVLSRIARGGMATVYRADDRRLGRHVALKVMHPHLAEGTDVAARFRREARAAARLAHPGVVQVFDQGSEDDTSYLTMEYVDGVNLRHRLSRVGAFSVATALDIVIAILDALAAAHHAGLVHRDIKPENVLLGADDVIKVADFGLARAVTEATAASTGTLLGTVAYLSPEIIADGRADPRADVYAVGVICYELMTGRQPFQGESAIAIAYQHVHDDLPAPSAVVADLPREVDEFIATVTARDPADRPDDADAALELALQLRRSLSAASLALIAPVANDPDPGAADTTEVDGGGDEIVASDATQAFTSGGTVALPIGAVHGDSEPARPRRRNRMLIVVLLTLGFLALGGAAAWYFISGPGAFITVPDVSGQTAGEAEGTLTQENLDSTETSEYSDTVPLGVVMRTDPAGGERIHRDDAVTIVVSDGVEMISMPDLAGLDEESARSALSEAGWDGDGDELTIEEDWSSEVPAEEFLSSDPEADSRLRHDESIRITFSAGPAPVTIINVEGTAAKDAQAELEDSGLAYVEADEAEHSDSVPEGSIISQSPEAGSEGHVGDEVTVVISKGPELVEVPDVFGEQVEDAEDILTDAGFEVERENIIGGIFATVHSQSIEPGEKEPKGTVVVLTIV